MKREHKWIIGTALACLLLIVGLYFQKTEQVEGSAMQGQDYMATSTRGFNGVAQTNLTVIKSGSGSLNRITVTGADTAVVYLWDATTTNANLRAASMASTSIFLASLPASLVAGTYEFDVEFKNGLLYQIASGSAATSTIIYR